MPAANETQRRFMCQALGVKTGSLSPDKLNPKFKDTIVKAANSMTVEQLEEFCKTKEG